jgi:hypothetical protein
MEARPLTPLQVFAAALGQAAIWLKTLIVRLLSGHIPTTPEEALMSWKPRLILSIVMTSIMVLMVTLLATWLALGFDANFLRHWIKAYFVAWPVAALTGFLFMPAARRITDRIMAMFGQT